MTHLTHGADLGRPLDEPLTDVLRTRTRSQEGAPDSIPAYEQMQSTYPEGSAEMAQGAYLQPTDDVSTFAVPDRASEEDISLDPLNDGKGRPLH